MDSPLVHVIGDVAAGGAAAGLVAAAGLFAIRVTRAERTALAVEADERCGGDRFRVLFSGVGRLAARHGFEDYVEDIERLQHRAGRGRLRSGREAVGQGLVYGALVAVLVVPLLWIAAGAFGLLVGGCGVGVMVMSIRSSLIAASEARKREIESELPYSLDLLGMCMSARASEVEALSIAARGEPRTAMTDVMERVQWECEHNVPIAESVTKVGKDLEVEVLMRMGHEIERSRTRGIDLPETFRTLADTERRRRFESAEAYANEVATRMLGPTGLVFLSALIVMLGPVVMSFFRQRAEV
jgi:Flp pilus assembly protein TadB